MGALGRLFFIIQVCVCAFFPLTDSGARNCNFFRVILSLLFPYTSSATFSSSNFVGVPSEDKLGHSLEVCFHQWSTLADRKSVV